MSARAGRFRGGFTLVELLVVIGIIGVMIALLMPSLAKARQQANWVKCQSNLRQIGGYLQTYVNDWKGWMFPPRLGANKPPEQRWPMFVFKPPVWNPPVMLCPSDQDPKNDHSYILNSHLVEHNIRFSSKNLAGKTSSDVIVMGEKTTDYTDYYMDPGDYKTRVEFYRHGPKLGSNYLFMDWHVGTFPKNLSLSGIDPWDIPVPPSEGP